MRLFNYILDSISIKQSCPCEHLLLLGVEVHQAILAKKVIPSHGVSVF